MAMWPPVANKCGADETNKPAIVAKIWSLACALRREIPENSGPYFRWTRRHDNRFRGRSLNRLDRHALREASPSQASDYMLEYRKIRQWQLLSQFYWQRKFDLISPNHLNNMHFLAKAIDWI